MLLFSVGGLMKSLYIVNLVSSGPCELLKIFTGSNIHMHVTGVNGLHTFLHINGAIRFTVSDRRLLNIVTHDRTLVSGTQALLTSRQRDIMTTLF